MGFAIRGGGILADWGTQFGFTKAELGTITGGGLVGFGITIIACSLIADQIGYKPLMMIAFLLHVLSAVVTLAATPVFAQYGKDATYSCLYWGMFLFALANGVCETVDQPTHGDDLSAPKDPLLEHSPCGLAGRPDSWAEFWRTCSSAAMPQSRISAGKFRLPSS